jgi:ADP-ribose pyrophosphatase YjhB (NUDIX family)
MEIRDTRPPDVSQNVRVIEYRPGKKPKKFIKNILSRKGKEQVIIWSAANGGGWKDDLLKIFKRIDAAGGVVKNEKGDLLFIFRLGKWDLPKGKLTKNETPEDGAKREVMEETGLKELELLKPLTTTYHIYERKGKRILKKTRWFEMSASGTQRLIPEAKENIEEVRWMAVDELAPVYENTYALVKELLLRFEEKRSRT